MINLVSISKFSDAVDAFVLSDVLSTEECDFLVSQTEELQKYSFWDLKHDRPRKDFRDADTVFISLSSLQLKIILLFIANINILLPELRNLFNNFFSLHL